MTILQCECMRVNVSVCIISYVLYVNELQNANLHLIKFQWFCKALLIQI